MGNSKTTGVFGSLASAELSFAKISALITRSSVLSLALCAMLVAICSRAEAQQAKVYRIGALLPGEAWYEVIEGLQAGLRQLGFEEGKHFILAIRDWKANAKAAEDAARSLEQEKFDLIYAASTGGTIAAKRATTDIPIIFCAGTEPIALGLVESFAKPGGRLTGVHYRTTELTAKRLEILKEIVPKLHRVVTFYNPRTAVAIESSKLARAAARQMGIQFIERQVSTPEELQAGLRALGAGEMDAYFAVSDPLAANEAPFIIDAAQLKRLPTMFDFLPFVIKGGLGSYAVSNYAVGRVSAKYVQRVLSGVKPKDLPVEGVDKIELVVNLKTARQIGLTIPPNVLARADRVIK